VNGIKTPRSVHLVTDLSTKLSSNPALFCENEDISMIVAIVHNSNLVASITSLSVLN